MLLSLILVFVGQPSPPGSLALAGQTKPRELPKFYDRAIAYLRDARRELVQDQRDWEKRTVNLPTYYQPDGSISRVTEKDVAKVFTIGTPSGDKHIALAFAENELVLTKAAAGYQSKTMDEVQFINTVVGVFGYSLQSQWAVVERAPSLYIDYLGRETDHKHGERWGRARKAKDALRSTGQSDAQLAAKFKEIDDETIADAKKDFDAMVDLMRGVGKWVVAKRHAIGEKLVALKQDLNLGVKQGNELYLRNAAFIKERFDIVWYGATFYGPETYPGQKERLGFRTSASGFWSYDFCKTRPYPDVQVTKDEPQMLGFMLPLNMPLPEVEPGTQVKIGKLSVTFRDLIDRALKRLKAQATALSTKREAVDGELEEAERQSKLAIDADLRLVAPASAIQTLLRNTSGIISTLEGTKELTNGADVKGLVSNREATAKEVADLQSQILVRRRGGRATELLERRLANKLLALNAIEDRIGEKLGKGEVAKYYRQIGKNLQSIRAKDLELQRMRADVLHQIVAAESRMQTGLENRISLDKQLLAIAQTVQGLDFDLAEISVQSDGKEVFRATSSSSFKELDEINGRLIELDKVLPDLERQRLEAKKRFIDASHEASDALGVVATLLKRQAFMKFGIDLLFSLYDVVYKGGSQGGIVGMIAETLKKVAEAAAFEYDWSPLKAKTKPDVDEGSIEESVKRDCDISLKDSLTFDELTAAGGKRWIKDTFFKYGKDEILNKHIGAKAFEKWELPWRFKHLPGLNAPGVSIADLRSKADLVNDKFKQLGKGYNYKWKNVAEGIFKDALKMGAKIYLEEQEKTAWTDYFQKDVHARLTYPAYKTLSGYYWQAFDLQEALLSRKSSLLASLDPSGFKVDVSELFSTKSNLKILLKWRTAPKGDVATVVVGESIATGGPGGIYQKSAGAVKEYSRGLVELVVR
ncbi:MAG: hypothetical protein H7Y17_02275 [Chlorobia bacterium]|nr:hypothetical protein [Fimbriimonadaceae bacterium]